MQSRLDKTLMELGINEDNAYSNLYFYSLIALTSLDLGAEAAGRLDVEAGRLLRMAQTMVRTRIDAILQMNFYGQNGAFKLANHPVNFLASFIPATGADKAEMVDNAKKQAVAAEAGMVAAGVESGYINLLTKLRDLAQIEERIYDAKPDELIWTTKDLEHIAGQLQASAASISAFIWEAIGILNKKLNHGISLWLCTKCGFLTKELGGDGYPFCKAQASLIVEFPFDPCGVVAEAADKLEG